ncbi:Diheme cytochrome c SoxD [Sulfurimonas denitrificans DSM 1251]|uniref:Diheme cytochrome c SoxD n=1 Tax=Sulfurimonas denitrificans (strain ATCC 33889 / DSM 1251) TaxID=326298 RepID=Q30NU8_SULDN|nr:c-type cytochrome [Sulfurimonas denitrificans]ABB45333.1 Diheme cytochrome c SoxD [Sulfurimonas denitrificans DSM 1251]MDD3442618.1 c-type cytochrome [Sulfurimonas denitrificans]
MIKLNNKLIILGVSVVASSALFFTGCLGSNASAGNSSAKVSSAANGMYNPTKDALDGGVTYKRENGMYAAYAVNDQATTGVNFGRTPTPNELKAWDTDIMPDGTGLPVGSGTVDDGEALYDKDCAVCHGEFGAGGKGYPTLTGGSLKSLSNQRTCPGKDAPNRTIGSYWPQASTLIWYIRDAMPYANPKSYTPDQMYAMTAYLLKENGVKIDGEDIEELNQDNFKKIVMPNRDGFYPNIDGPNGVENVKAFYKDPKNFGAVGVRCMTNCGKESVATIGNEITAVVPAYSTLRDLPPESASGPVSEAQKIYEKSCAVCHKTDTMGAPALGDKNAWATVLEQGINMVNNNAINGIGGMPPKGGAMDLSDDQVKDVVKFMVESSK